MNDNDLQQDIDQLERELVRDDGALAQQFAQLDPVSGRLEPSTHPIDPVREPHRAIVNVLVATGFALLFASVTMVWPTVLLVGMAALVIALGISERDERRYLRAITVRADPPRNDVQRRSIVGPQAPSSKS